MKEFFLLKFDDGTLKNGSSSVEGELHPLKYPKIKY